MESAKKATCEELDEVDVDKNGSSFEFVVRYMSSLQQC